MASALVTEGREPWSTWAVHLRVPWAGIMGQCVQRGPQVGLQSVSLARAPGSAESAVTQRAEPAPLGDLIYSCSSLPEHRAQVTRRTGF